MSMLLDPLPQGVRIHGQFFRLRTDYRTAIRFEMLTTDPEIPQAEKVLRGLQLFYPVIPEDLDEAVKQLLWFYSCGKRHNRYQQEKARATSERSSDARYSYEHDADYIWAAFKEQFGIDLTRAPGLHWWKFRAMFVSLSEDCMFSKIMKYRSIEITDDMPKPEKIFYRKMKRYYALPVSETEEERQDAIEKALLEGRSLKGIL